VANADLANNAVNSAKVADGSITSADIANGTIQIGDISAAAQDALTAYSGANWGVMDRNVINNGDAYLRAGPSHVPAIPPFVPPRGVGSLGIRTGGRDNARGGPSDDKAAFGNEVDFAGMLVSDLTAVSFFVYTTAENVESAVDNLPSISIEIDPNLATGPNAGDDFATMVYSPGFIVPLTWRRADAVNDTGRHWGLSSLDPTTPCHIDFARCTFEELIAFLTADDATDSEPAVIGSVAISKGRDYAFSGAVDALRINDTIYDFEPNGVFPTPAGP
jgi:hypothetical protein